MGGGPRSLKFSVDLPHMKLDLEGSEESLPEVRRIIELLGPDPEQEDPLLDFKARLSDEFLEHPPLSERLKNAMLLDEDVRVFKRVLPFDQEYDLETGKRSRQVSAVSVKSAVLSLFDGLQGTVRECLVHIRGELDREQQCVVMDSIRQHLGMDVTTRFFTTRKNLQGNILVETVCFGEGLMEAW